MISSLCLAFSILVTTGDSVTSLDIQYQECHAAKSYCDLRDDEWEVRHESLLTDYLEAKWKLTTLRTNLVIEGLRCESASYVLAENTQTDK